VRAEEHHKSLCRSMCIGTETALAIAGKQPSTAEAFSGRRRSRAPAEPNTAQTPAVSAGVTPLPRPTPPTVD